MKEHTWVEEFGGAVTVCDAGGRIIAMNAQARETFAADGGGALIGTDILDCHPEPARTKLARMMADRRPNIYTIEKRGVKKLIYQAPWHENGVYAGFVELSLEIPWDLPHFSRD